MKKDSIAQINKMLKQAKNDNDSEAEEALRNKKQAAAEEFDEKIEKVREELSDTYEDKYKNSLNNYPVFMAIAEEIGYDAVGRETGRNELPDISKELAAFILEVEADREDFFQ